MSALELYSYDACPFAQRTRMVLGEKGIEFDLHEVDVHNKPPRWKEISPYGKVPVLLHDGQSIYESAIINQYLDEAFPQPALMPATAAGRAQARIWMDYCESRFLPAAHKVLWERDQPEKHAANLTAIYEVLRFMEQEGLAKLSDGPYWFGDRPTLVDFQFLPFFERFSVYEALAGLKWPADCPRLRRWFDAMCERPSVSATLRPVESHIEQHHRLAAAIAKRRAASA